MAASHSKSGRTSCSRRGQDQARSGTAAKTVGETFGKTTPRVPLHHMAQGLVFSSIDARKALQVRLGLALQTEMRHQIMASWMNDAPGAFCDGS